MAIQEYGTPESWETGKSSTKIEDFLDKLNKNMKVIHKIPPDTPVIEHTNLNGGYGYGGTFANHAKVILADGTLVTFF